MRTIKEDDIINLNNEDLPSIDIVLPVYKESIDIITNRLNSYISMDYPTDKYTIYLLDELNLEDRINLVNDYKKM